MSYWGIFWATLATLGVAVVFNVRFRDLPLTALGGGLGWTVYLVVARSQGASSALAYFAASFAIAIYAEIVGRALKAPTTTYLVGALMPLVPGGGMYYMMLRSVNGDLAGMLSVGFETLTIAGAIASGVAVASAFARLMKRL